MSEVSTDFAPLLVFILAALVIVVVMVSAVTALTFCKIFAKAGYHWALGLLVLVPVVGTIPPLYLAFADWPVQRDLRRLQQQVGERGST